MTIDTTNDNFVSKILKKFHLLELFFRTFCNGTFVTVHTSVAIMALGASPSEPSNNEMFQ